MALLTDEALCLRLLPWEENHGLVCLLTRAHGKLKAVAKGIKRTQSSLAAAMQPGAHSLVSLARGKNLHTVTQARLQESFYSLRADLRRLACAAYLWELAENTTAVEQPNRQLFDLLLWAMHALGRTRSPRSIVRLVELTLLDLNGVGIVLRRCVVCGQALGENELALSLQAGGRLCRPCASKDRTHFRVAPSTLGALLALEALRPRRDIEDERLPEDEGAGVVIQRFVDHHFGFQSKSRSFVEYVFRPGAPVVAGRTA